MIDNHHNGRATKDDLSLFLRYISLPITDDQLECIMSRLDSSLNWDKFTEKDFLSFIETFSKKNILETKNTKK